MDPSRFRVLRRSPVALAVCLIVLLFSGLADGQGRRVTTLKDLIDVNNRLEVPAGTEVVWSDPHFERVWFSPKTKIHVRRDAQGFSAVFAAPGRYEGLYTVVPGHRAADVHRMTVIVRTRSVE